MTQIWEYIKIALMNIKSNKGRSFLTMLGIIIGMLISPKGNRSYGCSNGNTKIFNNKTDLEEKDNNDCK